MSVFMAGVLATLVPGLITGWMLAGVMGWAMRRDEYRRHPAPAPVMVPVFGERVSPPVAPTLITVHMHPGAALPQDWSPARVVQGRVLNLPAGGGDRWLTSTGTAMTRRDYPATR